MFQKFANKTSEIVGSPWAFIVAAISVIGWAISGPLFGFSDTWQLVINTSTTIITFLMVFLIQSTQNRDTKALHLKLDELIASIKDADNRYMSIEKMNPKDIDQLREELDERSSEETT